MSTYGPQFSPKGIQTVWNASAITDWLKCPRYYQYRWLDQWEEQTQSPHLVFGSIFAEALLVYYKSLAADAEREDAIRASVRFAWDKSRGWDSTHNLKNRFTLLRTLVWYFEEYKDDLPVHSDINGPAVERVFRIEIDNGNALVGTLDRVVVYSDALWIMDQKTTGSALGPHYFREWDLSSQMFNYTFAGQMLFGEAISGVIIDAAQIGAGFTRFARNPTYRTRSQLAEWYDETLLHIEDAQRATREQHFPRRLTSCSMYGGCAFAQICSKSPESRKNFLAGSFKRKDA